MLGSKRLYSDEIPETKSPDRQRLYSNFAILMYISRSPFLHTFQTVIKKKKRFKTANMNLLTGPTHINEKLPLCPVQ